jgi:hypothetical protein
MSKKTLNEKVDKIGVGLSALCLVHCLALPVIMATLPFVSFLSFMKQPFFEALIVIFAIFNAILAVTVGFKKHKKLIIPTFFLSGSILLGLFFFAHDFIHNNEYVITIGAALIGLGHIFNNSYCKSCKKCEINEQQH